MRISSSILSLKNINNDYRNKITLTDSISQTTNNTKGDKISIQQNITINDDVQNFNSGVIVNTNPVTPVSDKDLIKRSNSNTDTRSVYRLSEIRNENYLAIKVNRTINLLNLIKMSTLSNTSVDILDNSNKILKTIDNINSVLYTSSVIQYIIKNTNNNFTGQELENYSLLHLNQIPIIFDNNEISIKRHVDVDNILLSLTGIDWDNIISKHSGSGLSSVYKLKIALRFNIDKTQTFPITYPWVNTNMDNDYIYSEPIEIVCFIRSSDLLQKFKDKELNKIYIYL